MPTSALKMLFGPAAKQLLQGDWPREPLVFHAPRGRLPDVFLTGSLSSHRAFADAYHGQLYVAGGPEKQLVFGVDTQNPIDLYRSGLTVYTEIMDGPPDVTEFAGQLADEMGLPRGLIFPVAFASPPNQNRGFNPHFDADDTILLQLQGRKRLLVCDGPRVDAPVTGNGDGHIVTEDHVTEYGARSFPRLPRRRRFVMLRPGSAVLLPNGVWHGTQALDDSFSVTFILKWPKALDMFLSHLRAQLLQHREWRLPIRRAWGDRRFEDRGQHQVLSALAESLPADLGLLSPRQMLMSIRDQEARFSLIDDETRFVRVPTGPVSFQRANGSAEIQVRIREASGAGESSIECAPKLASAFRWIARRRGTFTVGQLIAGNKALSLDDARMVLRTASDIQLAHPILFRPRSNAGKRRHDGRRRLAASRSA
jgi:hypothetical protein